MNETQEVLPLSSDITLDVELARQMFWWDMKYFNYVPNPGHVTVEGRSTATLTPDDNS